MISYEPLYPPAELPTDIVDTLNVYSPDQLQHVAHYVEALTEQKVRESRLKEKSDDDGIEEHVVHYRPMEHTAFSMISKATPGTHRREPVWSTQTLEGPRPTAAALLARLVAPLRGIVRVH